MNYNIRFFDVLNRVILGLLFILNIFFISYFLEFSIIQYFTTIFPSILDSKLLNSMGATIVIVVMFTCYIIGILINSLYDIIAFGYTNNVNFDLKSRIPDNDLNAKILSNEENIYKKFIKIFFKTGNIDYVCESFKDKKNITAENIFPNWIFLAKKPFEVLSILSERIAEKQDINLINEYRYINEFFLSLRFIITINAISTILILIKGKLLIGCIILFACIAIFILFTEIATVYAYKYILHVAHCVKAQGLKIEPTLKKSGIPTAYVLIRSRTNRNIEHLQQALDCVYAQDYPNIKIILLLDVYDKIFPEIAFEKYKDKLIKFSTETSLGPAGTILLIKEKFVEMAHAQDVAIMLDDDDTFSAQDAITNIMNRFSRTDADICLHNFTTVDDAGFSLIKSDKKIHDNVLLKIYNENKSVTFSSSYALHAAASMGWTKSYRKCVLEKYTQLIHSVDASILDKRKVNPEICSEKTFTELYSYEDFPDYMCFIFENTKITAITETTHEYRQHADSVTSIIKHNCIKNRIGFLLYLYASVKKNTNLFILNDKNGTTSASFTLDFIKYKIYVICTNVLPKACIENYTKEIFLDDCKKAFQEYEQDMFVDFNGKRTSIFEYEYLSSFYKETEKRIMKKTSTTN